MDKILSDLHDRKIRLTKERQNHINKHMEMKGQFSKISETLKNPDIIKLSKNDKSVILYHKLYNKTPVTKKYLLAAVKLLDNDAFIITAFFTDKIKEGETLWPKK